MIDPGSTARMAKIAKIETTTKEMFFVAILRNILKFPSFLGFSHFYEAK